MSKAVDIYNYFANYTTTLKESSCDDSDKRDIKYMTQSSLPVVHFDRVKEEHYAPRRALTKQSRNIPCSCDALLLDKNSHLNIIEFKNITSAQNLKTADLKEKAYCSLIMLSDTFDIRIKDMSHWLVFIVVCNKKALLEKREAEARKRGIERAQRRNLQDASSFDFIAQTACAHGNEHIIS